MTKKFRPSDPCGLRCMLIGFAYDVVFDERWAPLVKVLVLGVAVWLLRP